MQIGSIRYFRRPPPALVTSTRRSQARSNALAAQSTSRLLRQLASSRRDETEDSLEKLLAVGREATGNEAAAAVDLAVLAETHEVNLPPTCLASGHRMSSGTAGITKKIVTTQHDSRQAGGFSSAQDPKRLESTASRKPTIRTATGTEKPRTFFKHAKNPDTQSFQAPHFFRREPSTRKRERNAPATRARRPSA